MESVRIPAITIICSLIGEIFKKIVFKKRSRYKYVPIVVGVSGGILGVIWYLISEEKIGNGNIIIAIAEGILSGLSSTGVNQIIKQIKEK